MCVTLWVRESSYEGFTGKNDHGRSTISNFFAIFTKEPRRLMATPLKEQPATIQISDPATKPSNRCRLQWVSPGCSLGWAGFIGLGSLLNCLGWVMLSKCQAHVILPIHPMFFTLYSWSCEHVWVVIIREMIVWVQRIMEKILPLLPKSGWWEKV